MEWRCIEDLELPPFDEAIWFQTRLRCLVAWGGYVGVGTYSYTKQGRGRWKDSLDRIAYPTHWMPLPAPPNA